MNYKACRRVIVRLGVFCALVLAGAVRGAEPDTGIIAQTSLGELSAGNLRPQAGCSYASEGAGPALTVRKVLTRYGAYLVRPASGTGAEFVLVDPLFDSELGTGEPPPSGLYQYLGMREYPDVGGAEGLRARTFQRLTDKARQKVQLAHERAVAALDPTQVSENVARLRKLRETTIKGIIDGMLAVPGTQFRLGRTEVTEAQWDVIMKDITAVREGAYPVAGVSWDACQEFIMKLNKCPEVQASGLRFRLPTVAEWRYACRAGSRGNWGMLSEKEAGNLPEMGWYSGNCRKGKSAVALKKPNAWGFYDMHGNVFEWCSDVSKEYGGDFRERVGGSFNSPAEQCTVKFSNSANRQFSTYGDQGFRLAAE